MQVQAAIYKVPFSSRPGQYNCPRRGLPRSNATILIDLVCLMSDVRKSLPNYRMVSAPASNADTFGVLSRGFGEGPTKKIFKHGRNRFPGTRISEFFWNLMFMICVYQNFRRSRNFLVSTKFGKLCSASLNST